MKTRSIKLTRIPSGHIVTDDFAADDIEIGAVYDGEVLVRALYISVDPYLALRIRSGSFEGGRIVSRLIGRVEASRSDAISAGDIVLGFGHWQNFSILKASECRVLKPVVRLPAYLGVIGHSGYTASLGIDLLNPGPEHTVTVSSAAGMVGAVAGQLAKMAGARVVGIAGGGKARDIIERYGFDAGVDYTENFEARLAAAVPAGIDRHFENVGATMLDPVLFQVNDHARIALCGLVAHYSDAAAISLLNFRRLLMKAVTLQAFRIDDHQEQYEAGLARLEALVVAGKLRSFETISHGLAALPDAFVAMVAGKGFGKHMVQVSE